MSALSEASTEASALPVVGSGIDRDTLLEQWMHVHGGAVLRLAYAYLLDKSLAEDVFQDVFLRAHRNCSRLRDETKVRAWLLKVTANRCHDIHRSSWWRRIFRSPELNGGIPEQYAEEDPVRLTEAEDRRKAVARAVCNLPTDFRETVHLYYFEQLTTEEIANVTGVQPATVHTRLHRARTLLKQTLNEWRIDL